MGQRLWVISEIFYPEEIGTGYYLTKLAEGLGHTLTVNVLCGYPTYSARGSVLPSHETHNGVRIKRCRGTTFNKDVLLLRLVNLITIESVDISQCSLECSKNRCRSGSHKSSIITFYD